MVAAFRNDAVFEQITDVGEQTEGDNLDDDNSDDGVVDKDELDEPPDQLAEHDIEECEISHELVFTQYR